MKTYKFTDKTYTLLVSAFTLGEAMSMVPEKFRYNLLTITK